MRKYIAVPLTCALAMMALTGCTDPSTLYENNNLVAQGTTSYKAAEWSQSRLTDEGTIDYAAGAVSLMGAKEAFSFTMHADSGCIRYYHLRYGSLQNPDCRYRYEICCSRVHGNGLRHHQT